MSNYTVISSRTNRWVRPRAYSDPSLRLQTYGPIQPMDGEPDPRRGMVRLTLLVALLFVLVLTLGSETVRGIVAGIPA